MGYHDFEIGDLIYWKYVEVGDIEVDGCTSYAFLNELNENVGLYHNAVLIPANTACVYLGYTKNFLDTKLVWVYIPGIGPAMTDWWQHAQKL